MYSNVHRREKLIWTTHKGEILLGDEDSRQSGAWQMISCTTDLVRVTLELDTFPCNINTCCHCHQRPHGTWKTCWNE